MYIAGRAGTGPEAPEQSGRCHGLERLNAINDSLKNEK